jgi:spermidine/putrescine-binding protein
VEIETHASDAEVVLRLAAAGAVPPFDAILIEQATLRELIAGDAVETVARRLIPNRSLIATPWSDPSYDPGGRHSIPQSYTPVGYALGPDAATEPAGTWQGFFALAAAQPGEVAVPDDGPVVIGAALVATGRRWNSDDPRDLAAARDVLTPLAPGLLVEGTLERAGLGRRRAALASGAGFRSPLRGGVRFVVPSDGTITRCRLWCIPVYARSPVSAHAWLDYVLDPANAADSVRASGLATPVLAASYLLPAGVLADPAVFVPPDDVPGLTFENLSDDAIAHRRELWAELFPPSARR